MGDIEQRLRLVFLGAGGVGKSAIIKRFLTNTFLEHYKETIEDLYCKEYDVQGSLLKVDILDTAGNFAFPAMRRLSISTAHAFVLVYAINNYPSFEEVKQLREQIMELRRNFHELPCVVVGNKCDCQSERQVSKDDVLHWIYTCGLSDTQALIEVSAKTNENIFEIFKLLLDQAKSPFVRMLEPMLKRRLSANAVEETADTNPDTQMEKEAKKFSRSRSLIRRGSKPRIKRILPKAKKMEKNDCTLS